MEPNRGNRRRDRKRGPGGRPTTAPQPRGTEGGPGTETGGTVRGPSLRSAGAERHRWPYASAVPTAGTAANMDGDRYEVEIDGDLLDVLASDTRRGILQSLGERRRTLSELARDLDRNKSTIHEHLGRLTDAELVRRDDDEDRKWTYYELTDQGERIINPDPGRTRVRLVIGAAVLGLVAGALVAASLAGLPGLLSPDGAPGEPVGDAAPDAAGSSELSVQVERAQALSTRGTTLEATVPGGDDLPGPWRAYLIPDDEATDAGVDGTTSGIEANATVEGENLTVVLPGDVRPGSYRLYVVAGDVRADVEDLPRVRLRESLADLEPGTYWRGFSGSVTLERTASIVPADATVVARPADGDGRAATVDLRDGRGNVTTDILDELPDGTYRFLALRDQDGPVPLGVQLEVDTPDVFLSPQVVREDRPVDVQVHVRPPAAADPGVPVTVDGRDQSTAVVDADTRTFRYEPPDPGAIDVQVGRLATEKLTVAPQVDADLEIVDGPAWQLTVRNETGEPAPGVDVRLDGTYLATTNASGQARIDVPEDGLHSLTLVPTRKPAVDVAVEAEGWNATVLEPELGLEARAESPTPGRVDVSVEAANGRPTDVDGTLVARVGDDVAGAGTVAVPPNSSTETVLSLEAAAVGDVDVGVEASAPGAPDLVVRNGTDPATGGVGGTSDDGDDADAGAMEDPEAEEGAVSAGWTLTNATVGPAVQETRDLSLVEPSPIEGLDDPATPGGDADSVEATPAAPAGLQVAALTAAAVAWRTARRRRR